MKNILFLLIFITVQSISAQIHRDEELIRKARKASNEAIAQKDIDGISKFWLDDYVVISGRGAIEVSKQSNTEFWKKMIQENPKTSFERSPTEILISKNNPNLAWESGSWKGFNTYSAGGRYSAQWKKKDGKWMLQAELFVALE